MRKTLTLALAGIFCLTLQAGAGEKKTLSVGYDNNPGHPVDLACQYWKKLVEERSGGSLSLELYPSTQLGKALDVVEQCLAGDATSVLTNTGYYANLGVKGWDVTAAPFLFNNWESFKILTESDWWADNEKQLEKIGIKIISNNWEYGDRHLLCKTPVRKASDLDGVKIRVPADNSVEAWKSLGCSPTPMSLSDAYLAMQQGTIDAIENPLTVLSDGSFNEVAKYLTLTAHKHDMTQFICGTAFFNSLDKREQDILLQTGREAADYFNKLAAETEAKMLDKLKAGGVTVITLTDAEKQAFQDKSSVYFDQPGSIWPREMREAVLKIVSK
jgi:tripartite ATP-independent transporter DctP family solute receptor